MFERYTTAGRVAARVRGTRSVRGGRRYVPICLSYVEVIVAAT